MLRRSAWVLLCAALLFVISLLLMPHPSTCKQGSFLAKWITLPSFPDRPYILYAPSAVNDAIPLVVVLHGGGGPLGSPENMLELSGWEEQAHTECFAAVFPRGRAADPTRPPQPNGDKKGYNPIVWSTTGESTEDEQYIHALISDIETMVHIDTSRIYATGFSNGGTFAYILSAHMSDTFAAVVPVEVAIEKNLLPYRPVSIMRISGFVADSDASPQLTADDPIRAWSYAIGCKEEGPSHSDEQIFLYRFTSCASGTEAASLYVRGMGHAYPGLAELFETSGSNAISATIEAWRFFEAHPRQIPSE